MLIDRKPFEALLSPAEIVEQYQARLRAARAIVSGRKATEHTIALLRDHDCQYRPHLQRRLQELLPVQESA